MLSQRSYVMRTVITYWQELEYLIKLNKYIFFHILDEQGQYKWLWHWNQGIKTQKEKLIKPDIKKRFKKIGQSSEKPC